MTKGSSRLDDVITAIDAANALDPRRICVSGVESPAALAYGQRMSARLADLAPDACEHLQIAARGQHIERWTSPRARCPQGRVGYLQWRKDLQQFHAARLGEMMAAAHYAAADIERVGALVRKERIKSDPELQLLEDVACLVFLEYELPAFIAKSDQEKLAGILAKTWRKMSPFGHVRAKNLNLPRPVLGLLERGLAQLSAAG
jgi:hypothetical protein